MFQSQMFCLTAYVDRTRGRMAVRGSFGRVLLTALTGAGAVAFIAAIAAIPTGVATLPAAVPSGFQAITLRAPSVLALRDQAEALRADLLTRSGVGAVRLVGLRQQSLAVDYASSRIARLGITRAALEASVPVDTARSKPGHIAVLSDDVMAIANTPVRAGARVFRLGDVAMVMRTPARPPISTLQIDGQPAICLEITPTK